MTGGCAFDHGGGGGGCGVEKVRMETHLFISRIQLSLSSPSLCNDYCNVNFHKSESVCSI